jgi:uncharacterized membrane protein
MSDGEGAGNADPQGRWHALLASTEVKFLLVGLILAVLYVTAIIAIRLRDVELSKNLVRVTTTHVLAGRAAGISLAYTQGMSGFAATAVNMIIEMLLVLHFYPLFVFFYRKLLIIEPLQDAMERVQSTAREHQKQIMKWGIPGLLLFVWFPFWMTGPLVGCVIGFLIGLRPIVNLTVVLTGTGVAMVCWGFVLKQVHNRLKALGPFVPFIFVGLVVLVAIAIHIRYAFHSHSEDQEDEAESDTDPSSPKGETGH